MSRPISSQRTSQEWTEVISPRRPWWDLRLHELWRYRFLISLFIRRDIVSVYKQTILGPLWLFLAPLFTVFMFTLVFNRIAGISTEGIPAPLFYMAGISIWNFFQGSFQACSTTFVANVNLFGKVYFPRLTVPIAAVLSNLFKFSMQMLAFLVLYIFYSLRGDFKPSITLNLLWLPFLLLIMGALAAGAGLIITSLTTKYRDLTFFIGFGVTLLMYATPVIYPISAIPEMYKSFIEINPISPLVESFRYALLGVGSHSWNSILYSFIFTIFQLLIGLIIFNRVEKNFMDTV
ncbi:MAG: ABC transporter permease [Flavobacteriales bacterium]|nr:ABC transporter permease [Flavobacteriales bacterium]MCX7767886.1 ABC transporter permease [Flavobacteriales bacterium]MDW8409290.1 ABC transporter permease [Flavobacteriales bacterium]